MLVERLVESVELWGLRLEYLVEMLENMKESLMVSNLVETLEHMKLLVVLLGPENNTKVHQ